MYERVCHTDAGDKTSCKTRQAARQDKTSCKTRQDKLGDKARQDKARQDKTRGRADELQDKTRQESVCHTDAGDLVAPRHELVITDADCSLRSPGLAA